MGLGCHWPPLPCWACVALAWFFPSGKQQWACLGVTWGLEVGGIGGNTFLSVKSPGAGALSALSQERAVSGRNRAQGSSAVLGDAKPAWCTCQVWEVSGVYRH